MNRKLLAPVFACLLTTLLPTQAGVRLARVPELVRLPATAGSNLLLEVEADGGATDVWLGTDLASRDRVVLTAAGERRWQLNLADPRVAAMLPAGRDGGELFVFATIGGATKQSAAIVWSRATNQDGKVRCLVRPTAGPTTTVENGNFAWLDAAKLDRIELQGAAGRQSAAVARIDGLELPLQRRSEGDLWVLDGNAALRERLRDATTLEIEARLGAVSAVFHFAVVPQKLELGTGDAKVVVPQRRRAAVPGSNGWLVVHVGDITMGGTLLHVTTADGQSVVAEQWLHERDFVELPLAGERYVLVVDDLVNLLVGDDRAELHVQPAAGFVPDRIGQLVRAVGASEDTFLREGKEYTGAMAQQFLVARLGSHRGAPVTLEEFVHTLASTSSRTGEPYQVRTKDGATVTMEEWLRSALAALLAKERADRK